MDNNVTKVEKNKNRLKKLRIASVSFILFRYNFIDLWYLYKS